MKTVIIRDMNQYMMEMNKIVRQLSDVGNNICQRGASQCKNWIKTYLRTNKVFNHSVLINSISRKSLYLSSQVYVESPADKYAPQIDHKAGLRAGGIWLIFDQARFDAYLKRYPNSLVKDRPHKFADDPAMLLNWVTTKEGLDSGTRAKFIEVGAVVVGAGQRGIYAQHPSGLHFMEGGFKFSTDPKKLVASYNISLKRFGLSGGGL